MNENQETEIKTVGLHIIQQAAENVETRKENGADEYQALTDETNRVVDIISGESFLGKMLFYHTVCETYEVGEDFESEQREEAVYVDDWRNGVDRGGWHIIYAAIEEQSDLLLNMEDEINGDVETFVDKRVGENEDDGGVPLDIRYARTLEEVVTTPDEETVREEVEANDGYALSFIEYIVLMDQMTDKYGLEQWETMTDTVVREGLSFRHFTWSIVETILPELTYNSEYEP